MGSDPSQPQTESTPDTLVLPLARPGRDSDRWEVMKPWTDEDLAYQPAINE